MGHLILTALSADRAITLFMGSVPVGVPLARLFSRLEYAGVKVGVNFV